MISLLHFDVPLFICIFSIYRKFDKDFAQVFPFGEGGFCKAKDG